MAVREFRLLAGRHFDARTGVMYEFDKKKEVIVESEENLDYLNKNKFEPVDGRESTTPKDHDDSPDAAGAVMDDLDKKQAVKKFQKGANLKQSNSERGAAARGITPKKLTEEHDKDFVDTSPAGLALRKSARTRAEEEERKKAAEEEEAETEEAVDFGDDVTKQFKSSAEKARLKVFKKGKHYNVVDVDDDKTPLEGGTNMVSKDAVKKFIKKYRS